MPDILNIVERKIMPNQLANETSPYLRQHQNNPVNWYPWGDAALDKAKNENKPIFLSIGYAACHWCHVMAHESFENPVIARILNESFISIKVDREERPDLDAIYMEAVNLLTGQGGWPMSVFLTPDMEPFYGGTYFPPEAHYGLPSFKQVLISIKDSWQNKQQSIYNNAQVITEALRKQISPHHTDEKAVDLGDIVNQLYQSYDWENGGWGQAPKFPQAMVIQFLIQRAYHADDQAKRLVVHLLTRMARGGLYDLVGGGFHRYSTDSQWLVPHFEKMLYDNAQLALTYLHAYNLTDHPFFKQVCVETLDFIRRELSHPNGGFYASLDADTVEGEGKYYAWHFDKLREILAPSDFEFLQKCTTLSPSGNFGEGLNILQLKEDPDDLSKALSLSKTELQSQLQSIFSKLREQRSFRTSPEKDNKVITAWNALAIRAFAEAGQLLDRSDYKALAIKALDFLTAELMGQGGELKRSWSQGRANQPATLTDYAGLILAMHAVYEINFSPKLFQMMLDMFQNMQDYFGPNEPLFFDSASHVTNLILRPQRLQDHATPSGNALAAHVYWVIAQYQHDPKHSDTLRKLFSAISHQSRQYPTSFGYWLQVADLDSQKTQQVALISPAGKDALQPFLDIYHSKYRPYSVIAGKFTGINQENSWPDLLSDRLPIKNLPTAYVCQGFTCQNPTTQLEVFIKLIK